MFTGIGLIPPASAANYVPWAIIGFLSQYVIRRRHFPFWAKYNCADLSCRFRGHERAHVDVFGADVLSAALDAGTAVSTILVYFM